MTVFSVKERSLRKTTRIDKRYIQTIINVVQVGMGIMRVVDYQWAPESVAVLQYMMRVVPESARLISRIESVVKIVARYDRALSYESNAVGPVRPVLSYPVPMLRQRPFQKTNTKQITYKLTIVVVSSMVVSLRLLMTLMENSWPCCHTPLVMGTQQDHR